MHDHDKPFPHVTHSVQSITPPPVQAERSEDLGRMIACAVGAYRAQISYATMEKRMREYNTEIDSSWGILAARLMAACNEAISERLLGVLK